MSKAKSAERVALRQVDYAHAVVEAILREAELAIDGADFENAAGHLSTAAKVAAAYVIGELTSRRLECLAHRLAQFIPSPLRDPIACTEPVRFLHVMTEALPVGGHTALVARFITNSPSRQVHHVALTDQEAFDSIALRSAVADSGGKIFGLGVHRTWRARCAELRLLAAWEADIVVLHTSMHDIAAVIAFASPKLPPVILMNHADHTFWMGGSIADIVVNLRESGEKFTEQFRGIARNYTLPIPLAESTYGETDPLRRKSVRDEMRKALGFADGEVLLITAAHETKFLPSGDVDFFKCARAILEQNPSARIVAVGPAPDSFGWPELSRGFPGRIVALGPRRDIGALFIAADIFIESFPFGSLTAMLEAGAFGLPCVRAPAVCPPPFASDGDALAHLPQPPTLMDFISIVGALVGDGKKRSVGGQLMRKAVCTYHLGNYWRARLSTLMAKIPTVHCYSVVDTYKPLSQDLVLYWQPHRRLAIPQDPLAFALEMTLAAGRKLSSVRHLAALGLGLSRSERGESSTAFVSMIFICLAGRVFGTGGAILFGRIFGLTRRRLAIEVLLERHIIWRFRSTKQ